MSMLVTALRYWHTLRHLKPVQFYGRLWFRLYRPRIDASSPAPPLRDARGSWQAPATRVPSMLGPHQFRFLNFEYSLPAQGGWNEPALDKLWLYNLHYFEDLNAKGADRRSAWHRALIERWLLENPPASGNGWEPYPTSLRIVNWVKWLAFGNTAPTGMVQSLAVQVRWLSARLEWHLLGNHLFANAKALVFAGLFFEGAEAASWLADGLRIIERELPEQVLPDGGNFERSTMYHAIFLEDVLDLVNAASHWPGKVPEQQGAQWRDAAARMLDWLAGMTHPDGEIAFFNDAAFGIAPTLAELRTYAQRLGISSVIADLIRNPVQPTTWIAASALPPRNDEATVIASETPQSSDEATVIASEAWQSRLSLLHFPDSGYIRLESDFAVALLDVAPIGPDYLPGHAHADTLSFELSVFGQRVVVNGGTSRYGLGPERLHERGTAAHSTVQVAGVDSSEVWGGFRVARRARPFDLRLNTNDAAATVACSHDGYMRLTGAPVHRREWVMSARTLRVTDTVAGGDHAAVARYIVHPDVQITAVGSNVWQLILPDEKRLRVQVLAGAAQLHAARYAPEFGRVLDAQCLAVTLAQGRSVLEWIWS